MKRILSFGCMLGLAVAATATPFNTAVLDGRPIEYDDYDFKDTFHGDPAWGANGTLTNLYVTWDATYLYVALQAWQADNNKLVVLIDLDPGNGTGATTTTNWTNVDPSFIKYNDYAWTGGGGFGLDVMFASEGTFNNCILVGYDGEEAPSTNNLESLFDAGNGTTPVGTPVDMASLNDATLCPHKGFEARIPWTNLYAGTRFGTVEPGETVPRGAAVHLLAGIHNNDPASAWSSPDTIPVQSAPDYTNGVVTTLDYMEVTVDANSDGEPDNFGSEGNAPYIRAAAGAIGGETVYVAFNEAVAATSVVDLAHWTVDGVAPIGATAQGAYGVLLDLATPIATNFVPIRVVGVQDLNGFSRTTDHCLFPAASGIPQAVAVTFQVYTNSGMGASSSHAKPTAFFINGSSLPLEWGYPPYETVPLAAIPGSNGWTTATVVFPPGSPTELYYKYSGRISGTNNYEAIRLTEYANASRLVTLPTNGDPVTVTEYLGAAAHPLRNPGDTNAPTGQNRLFNDEQRGDAGVRTNRTVLFQLDLSMRRRDGLQRVMVLGSDPLRGFNDTGDNEGGNSSDYPNNTIYLTWTNAGVQLFDDGTRGDATADDGIYSRLWSLTVDGYDDAIETNSPYSLVGGAASVYFPEEIPGTEPYLGDAYWITRRTPRSFIYKFYALTLDGTPLESPSSNLEYYVADPADASAIVLDPFTWDNETIPPPPPTNAPVGMDVVVSGETATVQFENVLSEGAHGLLISTNLPAGVAGFQDYGLRATAGATNDDMRVWTAAVPEISGVKEYYAPYAGLEPAPTPTYWEPNDNIPGGVTTVRVYFCQFQSNLKGYRSMDLTGTFSGWNQTNGLPMTFIGNGTWMIDLPLAAGDGVKFKPLGGPAHEWYTTGGDFQFIRGAGGVTMDPMPPVPGDLFTITLDASGTPLAAATDIRLHMGFDNWQDVQDSPRPAMTNTAGSIWEYSFEVSTNYSVSIDWVFTDGTGATWYSDYNWHAFMAPYYNRAP